MWRISKGGLQVIDASYPALPSLLGSYNTYMGDFTGYANGVYVTDNMAYVAESVFSIIDVGGCAVSGMVAHPPFYDFGGVKEGSPSGPQTFTVSNLNDVEIVVDTITITGTGASEFAILNENCSEQVIIPSGSCAIEAVFLPTTSGPKNADISIQFIDIDTPTLIVPVSGRVVETTTVDLPKTGQQSCYDEDGNIIDCRDTLQDGKVRAGFTWPSPRFTDNGDDTITDNLTGLTWTRDANLPGLVKTWQEALDYVSEMNTGENPNFGYTDWRLPNINELESLINTEQPNPAVWLESNGFKNVQSEYYWSSTSPPVNVYATCLKIRVDNLGFDVLVNLSKNNTFSLWPVREGSGSSTDIWNTGQKISYFPGDDGDLRMGVAWPSPRFTDNGDGTVADELTGLVWTKDANLPELIKTWQEALDYVKSMNAGLEQNFGFTDWRLPNYKEFLSLIDRSQNNPALPPGHPFINVDTYIASGYWSSTTYTDDKDSAWYIVMYYGTLGYEDKGSIFDTYPFGNSYVWPVRAGIRTFGVFGYFSLSGFPLLRYYRHRKQFSATGLYGSKHWRYRSCG